MELQTPNPFQELLLKAPLDEHLFAGTGKGPGKSAGVKFLVARDASLLKEDYACLIIRSSYQALLEIQADLLKYLSAVFPGTKYSTADSVFRLGGRDAPFGTVELAYSASSPMEQVRAMTRLQGRSKSTIIVDEAGATPTILEFTDELAGVLRGSPTVPRRMIVLANPGGPAHAALKARFVDPLPFELTHMKPQRFFSDHYQRFVISLTANATVNPHLDFEAYRREVQLMAHDDPDVLAALLEGKWGDLAGGSAFGPVWSPRRCRHELPSGYQLSEHMPRPFVVGDWGMSAPSAWYLCVPRPPGLDTPLGSIHLADELYTCSRDRSGRQWSQGSMLTNQEQAEALREWLERWGLRPRQIKILCDDAVFARNGSPNGSVAGDFKMAGVPLQPVGKNTATMESGLGALKSRLSSTRKNFTAPWLTWSTRCAAWEATVPSLSRDPNNVERIASGQVDHACDAGRYAVVWSNAKWITGQTDVRVW
ncbi:hypothetical protein SynBIOSE41_03963 [Synechococcus sp. BIOS-E4-1]|uniref:hypothetical protein n=1 Tax=Synechococcus sp. BIOS-E4-1 TaxID=1400864 RepID=UPI001645190E|nr:hypothetical protein [Synechococcus sp. BIOS-E4-1]QNI56428.1 hypothetical protein SynBIOSE41_03963 [Synechococcus sp. BIOS-E4-1]